MHGTWCVVLWLAVLQIHIRCMGPSWHGCASAYLSGVRSKDLNLLKKAKAAELARVVPDPSDEDVTKRPTKKELSAHVWRKNRSVQVTTMLIANLLETFSGPQGCDT